MERTLTLKCTYDAWYVARRVQYVWTGEWCDNQSTVCDNYHTNYQKFKEQINRVIQREIIPHFSFHGKVETILPEPLTDEDYAEIYLELAEIVRQEAEEELAREEGKINSLKQSIEDDKEIIERFSRYEESRKEYLKIISINMEKVKKELTTK